MMTFENIFSLPGEKNTTCLPSGPEFRGIATLMKLVTNEIRLGEDSRGEMHEKKNKNKRATAFADV